MALVFSPATSLLLLDADLDPAAVTGADLSMLGKGE